MIVQQSSVLFSVCELAINPAFAQALKQFNTNRPTAVILLHHAFRLKMCRNTRSFEQQDNRGGSRIFLRRGCTSKEWHHWRWGKKKNQIRIHEEESFISGGVRTPCTLPLDPPLISTRFCSDYYHHQWNRSTFQVISTNKWRQQEKCCVPSFLLNLIKVLLHVSFNMLCSCLSYNLHTNIITSS